MTSTQSKRHERRQPPPPPRAIPRRYATTLRVRYCECDAMGVAHHAAYIPWLEVSRTELLRESGVAYVDLERAGVFLVVTKLDIRYRRPARYDDEVTIVTRVVGGGKARIDHEYEVRRANEAGAFELLAEASSTLACVDRAGKPQPLPDWLTAEAHRAD